MNDFELKQAIGAKIKFERSKRGWTQEELAARSENGITKNALSKIENGKANLTITTLNSICQGLGIEVWELMVPSLDVIFAEKNGLTAELEKILADENITIDSCELGVLKMIPVDGIEDQSRTVYLLVLALLKMLRSPEFREPKS